MRNTVYQYKLGEAELSTYWLVLIQTQELRNSRENFIKGIRTLCAKSVNLAQKDKTKKAIASESK